MKKNDSLPQKPFYEDIVSRKKRGHTGKKPSGIPEGTNSGATGESADGTDARKSAGKAAGKSAGKSVARPIGQKAPFPRVDSRSSSRSVAQATPVSASVSTVPARAFPPLPSGTPVFTGLADGTAKLLEAFPAIVQDVLPLDGRKLQFLPSRIRELSHELTDERSERHVGYMNDPAILSAYIRYYQWWNLVRLCRLFTPLPFTLNSGDCAVDLGSGPLTVPIALWMCRPELRALDLTWFCVDISQNALKAGEEIFTALCAKTGGTPWKIVRVRGECGVSIQRRSALVTSANMFNELYWDNPLALEAQTKKHASDLIAYTGGTGAVLVIEPGIPRAGRFISLLRDALISKNFFVLAPCPHQLQCPFPGLRFGKWCHFTFDTADAPAALHRLSVDAGLAKDRAALSFVYARAEQSSAATESVSTGSISTETDPAKTALPKGVAPEALAVRIVSDVIKLPPFRTGRYGCSKLGMVLLAGSGSARAMLETCVSGSLVYVKVPELSTAERDGKTGALLISVDHPRTTGRPASTDSAPRQPPSRKAGRS